MHHTLEVSPGDHSIGNLLVDHLMQDDPLGFCAYKVPHPLSSNVEITLDVRDPGELLVRVSRACETARAQLEALDDELRAHYDAHEGTAAPVQEYAGPKLSVRVGCTVSDASMR